MSDQTSWPQDLDGQSVLASMDVGVVLYDRSLRCLLWNRFMESLTGIRADDLLGKNALEAFPDLKRRNVDVIFERVLNGETVRSEELHFQVPQTGRTGWLASIYSPYRDEEGAIIGIVVVVDDRTERKRSETRRQRLLDQRLHAQKLESMGRFAGQLAHEFNNVLTAILGYSDMLRATHPDPGTREGMAADVIFKSAERAVKLTEKVMGLSQDGEFRSEALLVNELIEQVLKQNAKRLSHHIKLERRLTDSMPVIEGDRQQLERVLTNLLLNAVDAMGEHDGVLSFETESVELGPDFAKNHPDTQPGPFVKIAISDTGRGMSREVRANLFEPFFTTKAQKQGAGLGLASAYGSVRSHGGQILCYSEEGRGTTFTLYLPASSRSVLQADRDTCLERGQGTLLFVDDEPNVRELAQYQLEGLGYKVLLAEDGIQALEIFREHVDVIDLVLLDLIMPRMSGQETFEELKQIRANVKTVLVSGYSRNARIQALLDAGMLGFVQKPFKLPEFSRVVKQALERP